MADKNLYSYPCADPEGGGGGGGGGDRGSKPPLENKKNIVFLSNTGLEVIKLFSCSTQLSTKFILLINVKMPTIIGILTFISRINTPSKS